MLSADGRPDVDSERASDHSGHVNVHERLERCRRRAGRLLSQFHVRIAAKQAWMVRRNAKRRDYPPQAPLAHEEHEPRKGRRPPVGNAVDPGHDDPPVSRRDSLADKTPMGKGERAPFVVAWKNPAWRYRERHSWDRGFRGLPRAGDSRFRHQSRLRSPSGSHYSSAAAQRIAITGSAPKISVGATSDSAVEAGAVTE